LQKERQQLLTAQLSSVVANFSMYAPKEPLCPADFMPGGRKPVEPATDEDLAAQFAAALSPISVQALPKE